jgi:hypothetical protein
MKKPWKLLIALAIAIPACAIAAEPYSSTFTNSGSSYTLKQNFLWGKECIINRGQHDLAPGQSTTLTIKAGCKWAGIRYDVYKNDQIIGTVAHNFREGKFSVEVASECNGAACGFTGMPPS